MAEENKIMLTDLESITDLIEGIGSRRGKR
jgi:hypothetical protein